MNSITGVLSTRLAVHKQSFLKSPETKGPPRDKSVFGWSSSHCSCSRVACSAGVFFQRAICSRKRDVETSRREEEMGQVKRERGEVAGREKRKVFFSPLPLPPFLLFALAPTVRVTFSTLPNLPLSKNQRRRLQQYYGHDQGFAHQKYACTAG